MIVACLYGRWCVMCVKQMIAIFGVRNQVKRVVLRPAIRLLRRVLPVYGSY